MLNLIDKVFAEVDYRLSTIDDNTTADEALRLIHMAQGAMAFVRGQVLQGFVNPSEEQSQRWEKYEDKLINLARIAKTSADAQTIQKFMTE